MMLLSVALYSYLKFPVVKSTNKVPIPLCGMGALGCCLNLAMARNKFHSSARKLGRSQTCFGPSQNCVWKVELESSAQSEMRYPVTSDRLSIIHVK
jgi:hypothetical protein